MAKKDSKNSKLTINGRMLIQACIAKGQPTTLIAERIGFSASTVYREIGRGSRIRNRGAGKTHLATGIGIEATSSHVSTYFIHFRDLVGRLKKAAAENREEYAVRNLNKYKLLIIDEIGYSPIDKAVAQPFFQLVAARYEKRPIVVMTNQPLSRWGRCSPTQYSPTRSSIAWCTIRR